MKQIITKKVTRSTLIGVVLLLSACVNTLEFTSPYKNGNMKNLEQAVEGAKLYFGSHQELLTRSAETPLNEDAPFVVGNIVPDWNSAVSVANNEKQYTDFTMRKDFDFYWLPNGNVEQRVKLYSRFASVEEFALDTINQYIATYIPDTEYLLSYPAVAQDYGINCAEWYEFSGTVLYTTISGHVVAVAHYTKGKSTKRAFLYDREKTAEENLLDFYAIMEGTVLGIGLAQQETRVVTDNEDNPIVIQEIIITAKKPFRPTLMSEEYPNTMVNPSDITPTIIIDLGGGGESTNNFTNDGGENDEEDKTTGEKTAKELFENYDSLSPSAKQELNEAMEQIINDCMGKVLTRALIDGKIILQYNTTYPEEFDIPENTKNVSAYVYDQNMLVYQGEGVDVLLHELFHCYQYLTAGSERTFDAAKANYEIEAQVARINYYKRENNPQGNDWKEQFSMGEDGSPYFILLSSGVDNKGLLKNGTTETYQELYEYVATFLENKSGFNYDKSLIMDYSNINALSNNC